MLWWWKDHFHTACSRDQGQSWGQGCRARVQVGETGVWKGGDQNRGVLSHPTTSRSAYWGASRDQHWGDVSIQFWGAVPTAEVGLGHEHCCFRASTRCSSWLLLYSFILFLSFNIYFWVSYYVPGIGGLSLGPHTEPSLQRYRDRPATRLHPHRGESQRHLSF